MFIEFILVLIVITSVVFIFDDIFSAYMLGKINTLQTIFSFAVIAVSGLTGVLMIVGG